MNFIKFTVSLETVKSDKQAHAVRHAVNWINNLNNGNYQKYEQSSIFKRMYFDDAGQSLYEPFSTHVIMGSNRASIYIEAENPTNIYNLFLFYWRILNKRKISSCKRCFIVPATFSFEIGERYA